VQTLPQESRADAASKRPVASAIWAATGDYAVDTDESGVAVAEAPKTTKKKRRRRRRRKPNGDKGSAAGS